MASYWKILTGVGVGVAAVAAAPFTGGGSVLAGASLFASLAGAGTIATAVGVGAVGGIAGAVIGENSEKERKKEINRARGEGAKAAKSKVASEYSKKISDVSSRLEGYQKHERHVIGLFAIGMAIAACNNVISEGQEEELNAIVAGLSHSSLPEKAKEMILMLREYPPSFSEAMTCASKYGVTADEVDTLIVMMAEEDGIVDEYEQKFIDKWHGYRPEYERMAA